MMILFTNNIKKYLSEFIGTFALVFFCVTGAIIVIQQYDCRLYLLGILVVFGIISSAMIYIFGTISSTQLNPSAAVVLIIGKLTTIKEAAFYISDQLPGAVLANVIL